MGGHKGECLVTLDTFHGCCRNVGNTNQIAEFLTIAFTFRTGHMIINFQTRTSSLTVKSEWHKQLHRHCNSVPSLWPLPRHHVFEFSTVIKHSFSANVLPARLPVALGHSNLIFRTNVLSLKTASSRSRTLPTLYSDSEDSDSHFEKKSSGSSLT